MREICGAAAGLTAATEEWDMRDNIGRRAVLRGVAALGATLAMPAYAGRALANPKFLRGLAADNGKQYKLTNFEAIDPRWKRQMVKYFSDEPVGSVVVDTRHHFLYWIWENKTAIRYGVGVGKEGFQWFGRAYVARKTRWPRWVPPQEMREREAAKGKILPEFMDGGPENPLGPRALYLHNEKGDTGYRIHGTVAPWSIGTNASSGCIRMFNEDALDLYRRCPIGTAVLVLEHIADRAAQAVQTE
jgi:lipoprotein-anchoring transpeptidase ErfK/SrfK